MMRNTYDPARPFGPWLVAIAKRRIIDRLRRKTRHNSRKLALAAERETFEAGVANFPYAEPPATIDAALRAAAVGAAAGRGASEAQRDVAESRRCLDSTIGGRPQGGNAPCDQGPARRVATGERRTVTETPEFIDALVASATPVRRLRPPVLRALLWLLLALVIIALLAVTHGVRSNLLEQLARPTFGLGIAGALATGVLAAMAAFMTTLPDRARLWALLPVPALLVWILTISYGLPLSIVMAVMLRNAAIVSAPSAILCGSIAIAAITSTALALLHDLDATVMVLIWTLGAAALISSLGAAFGRKLLLWISSHMTRGPAEVSGPGLRRDLG